ncbi:Chain length-determining protein [Rubrivivax sp. A210]|uniref:XrtA system polysaccharide chain length determinant n=1 Tax=Rubrivivax sp. A210 TaxID=2772301 RepID=UPI00191AA246|nr:XrtA system polysaccharide chain length determinant [Rubrivivax sp. A210]CAD5375203.1 Chain length-determining protein [Rubrivivax sp. A210]
MEEIVKQILAVVSGMWKFRWHGLVTAWVVALIGVIVVFRIPDQYEASARIFVDTDSILKPLMSGLAVQPNVEQQIGMLSRTLISRPNIEKLIRMADLDLKSEGRGEQDILVDKLIKAIEIRTTGGINLYSLAYRDADQEKAKRVIQSLVSIFVESGLGASRKDTDSAKTFLGEQIKSFETKLQEAEGRLKEFRLRNAEMQSADGKDAASRLAEINGQLEAARLQLREAENSRDAAKQQLQAERSQAGSTATQSLLQESAISVSTPEIDGRIDALKRNLDALLQRYTEQHPDVQSGRKLLKDLEEQKRKEMIELRKAAMATASVSPAGGGATGGGSLAAQELNRMLASSEVTVAALRARVSEYSGRLTQARASLKNAPQIEAEAAQLNRDYAITKKNYEDLVARRQSAVMSGELDVASGMAEFRLIDPPRVSPRPVSPNRLLLVPVVLLAALGVGAAAAFAGSQLRPTFSDANELRTKTGLPLLGVVTLVMSDADRRLERMRLIRFVSASGSLIGLFAAGLILMSLMGRYAVV